MSKNYSIIIASDLRTGRSVYRTQANNWSESVEQAVLIESGDPSDQRLAQAFSDEKDNLVIDPYLVAVDADRNPSEVREGIRVTGPSIFYGNAAVASAVIEAA